jgi:hypothetical protein
MSEGPERNLSRYESEGTCHRKRVTMLHNANDEYSLCRSIVLYHRCLKE